MGQGNDNNLDRIMAIQKWIGEKLAADPNDTLDNLERHMADPGQERLRPLFETFVGILPISLKAERGDVWGVAKGDKLWAKAYRDDFDTFYFNSGKVESGAHGYGFSYEVREDIIAVWDPAKPECNVIFQCGADGVWSKKFIRSDATVVVVRKESVVLFTKHGGTMVGHKGWRDVSTVCERYANGSVRLYDLPACDGVKAGKDWLVAWSRVDTTLTVHLVSGDHRESIEVENSTGDPTVFAPTSVGGAIVNITIAVETLGVDESWLNGERLFVVRHKEKKVVVNAFCLAGNRWQWNRVHGHPHGGSVEMNATRYKEFRHVKALELKGNVVCVLCNKPDRVGTDADDTLHVIAPNGSKLGCVDQVSEHRDATPLAQWPLVRHRTDGYRYIQIVDKDVVSIKIDTLSGYMSRKGEWLFSIRGNELTAYPAATRRVGALEDPIVLRGRKPFLVDTAVVSDTGKLFCAMQRSDKWVVVIGPRGQYGHDYHEVRDIAVVDGFVTFIGRVDCKVVRVRIPV